jgi:hypothetical protein
MATVREWFTRLWGTLRLSRRDAELEKELRLHLELATEDERRRANSGENAGRAAAIQSGGMAQAMEAVRDQRGLPWLDDLARDLRYGLRGLRRNPLFASVAVLTLALGIGANTAIFSLADAVLLRTLPVSNPRDLVVLRQRGPGRDIFPCTSAAAVDLAGSRDVLSELAAFRPLLKTHVSVGGEAELALAQLVSGNYHAALGIQNGARRPARPRRADGDQRSLRDCRRRARHRGSRGNRHRAGCARCPCRGPVRTVAYGPAHLVELGSRNSPDCVARRVRAGAPRVANRSRRGGQIRVEVRPSPQDRRVPSCKPASILRSLMGIVESLAQVSFTLARWELVQCQNGVRWLRKPTPAEPRVPVCPRAVQ